MFVLQNINKFINKSFNYLSCSKSDVDPKELFLSCIENSEGNAESFASEMVIARESLQQDLDFFFDSDPAAESKEEIVLAYPGYLAIAYHRVAHILYELKYSLYARVVSETAHKITGIDINPGATIGVPFFIDHGTGIVIGETSIIGKNVKIYQGVTLGALSLQRGHSMRGQKRHPTIGDNVTIYAGASVLGNVVIGDNVTIGSNVFITEDIPSNVKVSIAKPELVVKKK